MIWNKNFYLWPILIWVFCSKIFYWRNKSITCWYSSCMRHPVSCESMILSSSQPSSDHCCCLQKTYKRLIFPKVSRRRSYWLKWTQKRKSQKKISDNININIDLPFMVTFSAWIFRNAIIIKDKLILIVYVGGIVTLQVSLTQWRYIHHFSRFFSLPQVTKTEFLLTISIQYQAGRWWE